MIQQKLKRGIRYPNLPSAIRPVPHGPEVPVPDLPQLLACSTSESDNTNQDSADDVLLLVLCVQKYKQ